jgi:hypothetical protein
MSAIAAAFSVNFASSLNDRAGAADLYQFAAEGLGTSGRLLGELRPTGAIPTFADEVAQMGCQDRVNLTPKIFPVGPYQLNVRQI